MLIVLGAIHKAPPRLSYCPSQESALLQLGSRWSPRRSCCGVFADRPMAALLGCIADDFTGGTDVAGMLVKHGMRTVQMIGVPQAPPPADADAVVVALKTRTGPVEQAISESLAALRWLQQAGCRQFYFKYSSTFDS